MPTPNLRITIDRDEIVSYQILADVIERDLNQE